MAMDLIRHTDLRSNIAVNLTVLEKHVLKAANMERHGVRDIVIDAIMRALHGCVIVRPDPVGYGHGMFGVSEPHPFPDLITAEEQAAIEIANGPRLPGL